MSVPRWSCHLYPCFGCTTGDLCSQIAPDSPVAPLPCRDHFLSRYNGAMSRLLPEEVFSQGGVAGAAKNLGKKAIKKARRAG